MLYCVYTVRMSTAATNLLIVSHPRGTGKRDWKRIAHVYLGVSLFVWFAMDVLGLMVTDNPNAFANTAADFNGDNACNEHNPATTLSVSTKSFFLTAGVISIIFLVWLICIAAYSFKVIFTDRPEMGHWRRRTELVTYWSMLMYAVYSFMWLIVGINVYGALPAHGVADIGINCKRTPSGKMLISWIAIRGLTIAVGIALLCVFKRR